MLIADIPDILIGNLAALKISFAAVRIASADLFAKLWECLGSFGDPVFPLYDKLINSIYAHIGARSKAMCTTPHFSIARIFSLPIAG